MSNQPEQWKGIQLRGAQNNPDSISKIRGEVEGIYEYRNRPKNFCVFCRNEQISEMEDESEPVLTIYFSPAAAQYCSRLGFFQLARDVQVPATPTEDSVVFAGENDCFKNLILS